MGNKGFYLKTRGSWVLARESLFRFCLVRLSLFRIFWNSLLAYVFIYIDLVFDQPGRGTGNNRRYGLIIIVMYGAFQVLIKTILAIWHHFKFHLTCCFNTLEPERKQKVDILWEELKLEYKHIETMAINRESHA